ncbi:hypothetical protein [Methylobacterium sp. J-067]|uniref:hypothetical protein n=1 Tax=Methylobacterium sp. J-067 TaxID=2836648 RepID=UPI001FBAC006|nr:hypothetical protein [Methylobacterium sp. J-067]MCJ2022844.1 hypothetical protein [Methylobacterium sp. J-067]
MDYGYDLAALVSSGLKDERDASRRIIKRLKSISKDIERSDRVDTATKMQMSARIKDARRIIDQLMHLIEISHDGQVPKWVLKFRLMRLVDSMLEVGSHNGAGYAGVISSEIANRPRSETAANKNKILRSIIQDEAQAKGLVLKNSDKFAQRIESGVRKRAGVDADTEGFGWPTIRREIKALIKEKKGQTQA